MDNQTQLEILIETLERIASNSSPTDDPYGKDYKTTDSPAIRAERLAWFEAGQIAREALASIEGKD
jgi:hypothetical protein